MISNLDFWSTVTRLNMNLFRNISTKSSVSCCKNADLFLPLEWSLCWTNTHFVSFVSDLSSGVRPRCRSSTGAFCSTSPGCWWRLCTCRRCCSSPSLTSGSSSGSTPLSAGVRPVFTRVQVSSPVLVFILPLWCCRSSVGDCCDLDPAEKTVWWWGVSLLSLYQSILRYFHVVIILLRVCAGVGTTWRAVCGG